jgi:hypothetical protein
MFVLGGAIRSYAPILCSLCRPGEGIPLEMAECQVKAFADRDLQLLLAYCALDGNTVAQYILAKRFWHTTADEIVAIWGYPIYLKSSN